MTTTQQPPDAQQQPQQQPQSGKRIVVKNLPPGISKEELRELGDRHGRVINVELVSKPQHGKPFGFISYLSEEDAEFSLYRLSGYIYKSFPLEVAFSKPSQKPTVGQNPGQTNKPNNPQKQPKKKKPMYSLRTLTPLNPPTHTQQGYSNLAQQPKAWDNAPGPAVPAPANNNDQPVDDGFVQANDKTNKGNNTGKGRRNNNNNLNRSKGKNYKQAAPNEAIEDEEQLPLESMPPQDSPISMTDVQISISADQYWNLKLGPDQLDAFLKAVDPFLQFNEFHN
jgi:RNA recognition motif-containing protein